MRKYITLYILLLCNSLYAYVPEGYYANINGKKCVELKAALNAIIAQHEELGYNSLWDYYYLTYTHPDNRQRVLDMYSDNEYFFSSTTAVANMNKEHSVPKSWWEGGQNVAPGYDLYNVIPSDANANIRKSNNPMGVVTDPKAWTNGTTKVGTGTIGSVTTTFFEPADQYKGDFARIYFYMATCYPDLKWLADKGAYMSENLPLTIEDWILPTLISWSNADPVDDEEILRNENVSAIQHNRNPFVDYPELVDYIWGSKKDEAFVLTAHTANETAQSTFHAAVPIFSINGGTAESPKDLAAGTAVRIKGSTSSSTLYYRIDNGEWQTQKYTTGYSQTTHTPYPVAPQVELTIDRDTRIQAYCTQDDREPSEVIDYYYHTVNYDELYLFYEAFEGLSGNSNSAQGSSGPWAGNDNFPIVETVYCAGNAVRLGNGSSTGSMTSRKLNFAGGTLTVGLGVKGWTTIEGDFNVSVSGSKAKTVKYTSKMADDWEPISLTFEQVTANPTITISTTAKRAFLNFVSVESSLLNSISAPTVTTTDIYYTIHGQRLSSRPTLPGLYIINGKKVLVK